jgi:hypothetical protein
LEKDRARRYATASELAADLARWQGGEPVQAQPPTLGYLLGKALRRHRGRVALVASLVLAVLLGTAALGTTLAMIRIDRERHNAEVARHNAEEARRQAEIDLDREAEARRNIESLKEELRLRLVQTVDVANGFQALDRGDPIGSLAWFADALRLELGVPERETMNRIRLEAALQQGPRLTQVLFHEAPVYHASFSPDGRRILTASGDDTARVWDADTGQHVTPPMKHEGYVGHASFSPDGRRVLTASDDKTARVWDADTGEPLTLPLKHQGHVVHASFSPDGRCVVTAGWDNTARVWNAATGQPIRTLEHEGPPNHASFSLDGRRVLTASGDKSARVCRRPLEVPSCLCSRLSPRPFPN